VKLQAHNSHAHQILENKLRAVRQRTERTRNVKCVTMCLILELRYAVSYQRLTEDIRSLCPVMRRGGVIKNITFLFAPVSYSGPNREHEDMYLSDGNYFSRDFGCISPPD
jgi:hypothetical protein